MSEPPKVAILLVDHEKLTLEGLGDALAREGHTVFLAENGPTALGILRTQSIDLVIADHQLPGVKGEALLIKVRNGYPRVLRALVAGYGDLDAVIRSLEEGIAHQFFPKPADPAAIAAAVPALLAARPPVDDPGGPVRRVLLAENSFLHRHRLLGILTPFFVVTAVENGLAAIRAARTDRPDLVITGLRLEGIGGLDLIRFLRIGLSLACPVIVWDERCLLEGPSGAAVRAEVDGMVERVDLTMDALLAEARRLTQPRMARPSRRK